MYLKYLALYFASKQLAMENTACQLEIERSEDRNVVTRRRFVESIVLASHIGLRKQFQHMEIIKLYQQLQHAEDAWNNTKERLRSVKSQERELTLENTSLGAIINNLVQYFFRHRTLVLFRRAGWYD